MKPLPLNVQTLYADLTQSVTFSTTPPGSVFTQTIRGKPYLYAAEKHGAVRITRYLGLAEDPETTERYECRKMLGGQQHNVPATNAALRGRCGTFSYR